MPQTVIRDVKPDVIVNAAAYTAVDKAEQEEKLATTVNGTAVGVLAEEARKAGILLVHYSTDYVFDGAKQTPYTEDDAPHPDQCLWTQQIGGRYRGAPGRRRLCRSCAPVGSMPARGHNFLRTILRLAGERDELRIVDDQIGAPTWARDIADATARIVQRRSPRTGAGAFASGIFNLTAAGATSWYGFAEAILEEAKRHGLLQRVAAAQRRSRAQTIRRRPHGRRIRVCPGSASARDLASRCPTGGHRSRAASRR